MKLTFTVAMDTDRDHDVIAWLDAQPNRSAAIRDAIRVCLDGDQQVDGTALSLERIERKLDALRRDITSTVRNGEHEPDEPPDVAAALDGLGV